MKKTIIIAGGSGFLGKALQRYFEEKACEVFILSRSPKGSKEVYWDGVNMGEWSALLENSYALINLAGKSVNCRYTEKNKAEIRSSRLASTQVLGKAIAACAHPPTCWLNASTATIYADTRGNAPANTEREGKIEDDFSVLVAKDWEANFFAAKTPDTRKIALRTAIVYGEGGAFPVILDLAKKGLCTPQGDGNQWISWLHREDFCAVVDFLMDKEAEGIFNVCAPNPIKNKDFYTLLAEKIKPPVLIPQPGWLLELGAIFMRTETELILKSRKVYPEKLLEQGFVFSYAKAEEALEELLNKAII